MLYYEKYPYKKIDKTITLTLITNRSKLSIILVMKRTGSNNIVTFLIS